MHCKNASEEAASDSEYLLAWYRNLMRALAVKLKKKRNVKRW